MSYLNLKHAKLKELPLEDAKNYILGNGYFHDGYVLPGKIHPDGLRVDLTPVDWSARNGVPRTSSLDIIVDKSSHGVRRYSLVHPYIYIQLANEILGSFDRIRDLLLEETAVVVYSLPTFSDDTSINADWSHFSRIDPSENLWKDYKYVVNADIYNFYESIYTHSISWAIETKNVAKGNMGLTLLGNRVDKLFQNAHDGQTNGIPTGNVLSDIAAELVLKDIDRLISETLSRYDVKAYRYRDDYRFLCRSKGDALSIIDTLAYKLATEYGLTLNKNKTKIQTATEYTKSVVERTSAPTLLQAEGDFGNFYWRQLHEFLVECRTADLNKRGLYDSYIESFTNKLKSNSTPLVITDSVEDWVDSLYATIIDAIESGISTSPHIYFILDLIFQHLDDEQKIKTITNDLAGRITDGHNEVRIVWTYALLTRYNYDAATLLVSNADSKLLNFVVDKELTAIDKFTSRDLVPNEDGEALKSVELIDFEFVSTTDSIDVEDLMVDSISDEFYESISMSHYLNR